MKVSEALDVLKVLDPDIEVTITFGSSVKKPTEFWPPFTVSPPAPTYWYTNTPIPPGIITCDIDKLLH